MSCFQLKGGLIVCVVALWGYEGLCLGEKIAEDARIDLEDDGTSFANTPI
jgi:hypothetical protein